MAMASQYFVSGSILRHIFSMAHTSMLALVAMVLVDALDLFFLSLLGDVEIIAGLGFAWPIIFFTLAVSLGISTAMTALVSRAEGLGDRERAKIYATHILVFGLALSGVMTVVLWLAAPLMLGVFGAVGKAHEIGATYVQIVILCLPVLVLSMSSGALLRAIGAKQRAMWSKMVGAGVNAILDPIFIFGFDWGVEGAAWATVLSRIAIMAVAFYGVRNVHHMLGRFNGELFRKDIGDIARVTVPVGLAKVGPPMASAFIMASMAKFGSDAVAAMAIIERIAPLFLFQGQISRLFSATDQTTAYLAIFCSFTAPFYVFQGLQFSSHTFFNVTGRPNLAMVFDLAKELLGVIPLVWLGSYYLGAVGVLAGQAAGIFLFGAVTGIVSYRVACRAQPLACTGEPEIGSTT